MSIAVQHASGSVGRAIYGLVRKLMSIAVQYAPGAVLAEPSMDWLGSYEHCGTVCSGRSVDRAIYELAGKL